MLVCACVVCFVQVIVKVLSLLFARLPAHPSLVRRHKDDDSNVVSNRPSLLARDKSLAALEAFNSRTRDLFISHLKKEVAAGSSSKSAFSLPLTKAELYSGSGSSGTAALASGAGALAYLQSNSRPLGLRSPFVALRGFGDSFGTVKELARDIRGDVFVCSSQVCGCSEGWCGEV